jgi:hypothetical protein
VCTARAPLCSHIVVTYHQPKHEPKAHVIVHNGII